MEEQENKVMSFEDVMKFIKEMAFSQGFYSRLYEEIMQTQKFAPARFEGIKEEINNKKFKNVLEVIEYFEE